MKLPRAPSGIARSKGCLARRSPAHRAPWRRSARDRAVADAARCRNPGPAWHRRARAVRARLSREAAPRLRQARAARATRLWGLAWVDDPANESRSTIATTCGCGLPELAERWPAAPRMAQRLAEQNGRSAERFSGDALQDASTLAAEDAIAREELIGLPPSRQRNLLRHLVRTAGLPIPSAQKVEELRAAVLSSAEDAHTHVRWPAGTAGLSRRLYLLRPTGPALRPGLSRPCRPDGTLVRASDGSCFVQLAGMRGFPGVAREGLGLRSRGWRGIAPLPVAGTYAQTEELAARGAHRTVDARPLAAAYRQRPMVAVADLCSTRRCAARRRAALARPLGALIRPSATLLSPAPTAWGWSGRDHFWYFVIPSPGEPKRRSFESSSAPKKSADWLCFFETLNASELAALQGRRCK